MKKILAVLISVITVLGMICSCQHSEDPVKPDKHVDHVNAEDAVSVDQIVSQMHLSDDLPLYSELKKDKNYLGYFDLLDQESYLFFKINGKKYIFLLYTYYDTGHELVKVKGAKQKYTGRSLDITFDTELLDTSRGGCFPSADYARCLLRVDDDFDPETCTVNISDYPVPIERYKGGMFRVGKKWGMADKDLNITVPVICDGIYELETDRVEDYYRLYIDGYNGLVGPDRQYVLHPEYSNFVIVSADRFIVMKSDYENDGHMIALVDSHENIIHDYMPGFIDMQSWSSYNSAEQYIFSVKSGNRYLEGVMDAEMNIIIEPKYTNIAEYYQDSPHMYYAVENEQGKCAVIGTDGALKNDFIYNSVYDASEEYFHRMGGYGYF